MQVKSVYAKCDDCLIYQLYELHKCPVPEDPVEKNVFMEKLLEHNVSLRQYSNSLEMEDVTM